MPRVIFKCPYLKSGDAAHKENLVSYMATRNGVQKISIRNKELPATLKQEQFISQLLKEFPDTKNLFEYEDYLQNKTLENGAEFISIALEHNLDVVAKKENYVDYIANRPRVEKLSSHGLFNGGDEPIVLSKLAKTVADHSGNVWTPIISLRREDAVNTGFDNAQRWKDYISSYAPTIAESMKIPLEDFCWYAAFHNESHHPHIHMICYSQNPRHGFLDKKGIAKIKSGLLSGIFQQEMKEIYALQTQRRDMLKAESKKALEKLIAEISAGNIHSTKIETLLMELAENLKCTKGKRVYGYLPPRIKLLVDNITDELAQEPLIANAYRLWQEMRNEVTASYKDTSEPMLPLSRQKEFKSIKNRIIYEADRLAKGEISLTELDDTEQAEPLDLLQDENIYDDVGESADPVEDDESDVTTAPYVKWTDEYKQAREFLFGTDDIASDFEQAFTLLRAESQNGNGLAVFDLGRMYADGLGVEIDTQTAQEYYAKALDGFEILEHRKPWKYLEYRIGKMYSQGLGTGHKVNCPEGAREGGLDRSYELAADWFTKSANQKYKFAEYSLGGQYMRGQGVEQDNEKAFELYLRSAKQGFPYAALEVAKMFRDGIGTEKDTEQSKLYFEKAYMGFVALEKQSHDDKLQYRLGWMLKNGIGTEQDISKAKEYFQKSAKRGNTFACYALAKIILSEEAPAAEEVKQAVKYLQTASDSGNPFAEYALAKLYYEGKYVGRNIEKAVELFTLSAEQDNEWAAYSLGRIYLTEESCKDIQKAVTWLTKAAEQGNQYSQYILGKLYLMGNAVPRDKDTAIKWFMLSAAQGNEYAQFFLDNMDKWKEPSVSFAVSRLMHHMSKIFENNQPPQKSMTGLQIDSKRMKKLREKKMAQGHKRDDHEQQMNY